jgi:hypothetical protein
MDEDVLDLPGESSNEPTMSEPSLPRESRNLPERESSGVTPSRDGSVGASSNGVVPSPSGSQTPAPDPRLSQYEQAMQYQAQQLRAHQAQQAQLRDLVWQLQTQGMPPEQLEYANAQRALREEALRVQSAQRQFAAQQQQMEVVYKEIAVRDYLEDGKKFGISRDELRECDSPQEMERLVRRAEARAKQASAQTVTQQGKVATSGGRTARPNWLKMDTREMLEKYLG